MPPKGGRARGVRGRGGANRSAGNEAPASTSSAAENTTPATFQQAEANPTHAASRSDTATPGPTAPAARATPSGTPNTTPAPSASSGRAKFKPKAVRRSEEERIRRAEEIAKQQEWRNAEEAKSSSRLNRWRGRGRGRARGVFRYMGRGSTAAGPLSAGIAFGGGGGHSFGTKYGASSEIDNSRINADVLFNAVDYSDEEEPVAKGQQKKKKVPLPMGIRRVEHKEEEVTLATAAEIEAQEHGVVEQVDNDSDSEGLFVDEARSKKEEARQPDQDDEVWEHAVPKSRVKIKDENDEMDLDEIPEVFSAQKKKSVFRNGIKADTEDEHKAESMRYMFDLLALKGQPLDGHMFLFQFPGVLAPLTTATPGESNAATNLDPKEEGHGDVEPTPPAKGPPANIDLTKTPDKVEDEDYDSEDDDAGDVMVKGGFLGNLVVRKSGKVELSWGGSNLNVVHSEQPSFLRTVVLLQEDENGKTQAGKPSGAAISMGKIQGSFKLGLQLEAEKEWIVNPEDLVTDE